MIYLDNFSYEKIEKGDRGNLRFRVRNILESDIEKIEKILDRWAKRGLKHFLIEKKKDTYKEGFLKRKDIKEITYSKKTFSRNLTEKKSNMYKKGLHKRKDIEEAAYLEKKISHYFYHYASITSKPVLNLSKNNYNVNLYINFPGEKCRKVFDDIIKELN